MTDMTSHDIQLQIDQVTKSFGGGKVLDNVTLSIPRGAFVTLLGPSGCGKTTLLRTIAGFYEADSGSILLDNRQIDRLPAHRRGVAMVFQDYALFPHMTVADNVAYGLRLAKVSRDQVARRVEDILKFVGLPALGDRLPGQLSGGQQQRVALARALVVDPKVLMLDEPLSNLDASLRERMRWELRALQQQLQKLFLYVTHDQSEALAMSDWIAVMNNGCVEQWGTPQEIYYRPRSRFVANFVGLANIVEAPVLECHGENLLVQFNEHCLDLVPAHKPVGNKVLLCIRPEAVSISTTALEKPAISLTGSVARLAFLGSITRYWVLIGDTEWIVDNANLALAEPIAYGSVVTITFRPSQVHVLAAE